MTWCFGTFLLGPAGAPFFAAIAATTGVTVRTGKVVERPHPGRARTRDTLRETLQFFRLDEEPILEKFDELWELYPVRQQKGVDTLIISDMLMGAVNQDFNTVVLVSGDSDLADPFRTVKSLGCKTVLVVPTETGLAPELKRIADETIRIPYNELRQILYRRQNSQRRNRRPASIVSGHSQPEGRDNAKPDQPARRA